MLKYYRMTRPISGVLGGWTYHREVPANHFIEPNPAGKRLRQVLVALDKQRFSDHVAPKRVPEIDRDEIGDLAANDHIHRMTRILGADVDTRALKHQPQDAELGPVCRHAGELKPGDDAPVGQRIADCPLAEAP